MNIRKKLLFIAISSTIAVVGIAYLTHGARTRMRQASEQLEVQWKERRQLEGNWEIIEARINGEPAPGHFRKLQFSGATVTVELESRRFDIYWYTPELEKHPREINLGVWPSADDRIRLHGIYTLTDDTLQMCWTTADEARPTELRTEKGDRRTVIVARRSDKRGNQH